MDTPNTQILSVCILGGGTAGWMTAAALAHKLQGSGINVTLVESDAIGTVGVGEATLPHIRFFNNTLGIDEAEFMRATNATFKLGIEFCDWSRIGDSYIHPFGDFGQPMKGPGGAVAFHHVWNRLRQDGEAGALDDYSYPVVAAREGRFHLPDPDPDKIESTFGYAYQFDSSRYAVFLRAFAEARGITRVEGRVSDVTRNAESGHVETLVLDDGRMLSAELFIDCSGFRGLLIEQTLESGYDDWSEWLPVDRAVAVPTETVGKVFPYTRATAREAGWQWRIPLQHRTGNGYVYCSDYTTDEAAHDLLMSTVDGKPTADPKQLYFCTGRRNDFWASNVVAIGLSAGFLEPLESTSIHLIQEGITALLELFPDTGFAESDRAEYNARMGLHYERVRDFLLLHYVATQRDDSEMWRHFRSLTLPESLQDKIEAWTHRGLVPSYEHSVFLPPSWVAVFAGQKVLPRAGDPRLGRVPSADVQAYADTTRDSIARAVSRAPAHTSFIERHGARAPSLPNKTVAA